MTTARLLATLFLLSNLVIFASGACQNLCDNVDKLSNTQASGGCVRTRENGKNWSNGWDATNSGTTKIWTPNMLAMNINPTKLKDVPQIGQYRKQTATLCMVSCVNQFPTKGTNQSPRPNWPFDKNVDQYACTMNPE